MRLAAAIAIACASLVATAQPQRIAYASAQGVFVDGKRLTTDDAAIVPEGAWSPDGTRILLLAARRGDASAAPFHFPLYVIDADGTHERRLIDIAVLPDVRWSPDGKSVLARNGDALLVIDTTTGTHRRLASATSSAQWSPDGARIVAGDGDGIYVIDAGGSHLTRLAHLGMRERDPVWSPDAKSIAFVADGWFVMDASGANKKRVSRLPAERVRWSPDGAHLLVAGGGGAYVCDARGANSHVLATGYGPILDPVFTRDGRRVVFRTREKLYSVNVDGSDLRTIDDRFRGSTGFALAP